MLIEENEYYKFNYVKGNTSFQGCQCSKDCTCNEDFVSETFEYWVVQNKKGKKQKRTKYWDFRDAYKRIEQILEMYKDK